MKNTAVVCLSGWRCETSKEGGIRLKVKNPASRRGFFYHTFLKILMMQYVMAEIINGIIATIIFTTMSL